ncbi:MAG: cobalamin-binding protein [Gracilimonas sp.]|uniref:cobalamin-binding protein n=1 Tax=Gracilimonas sp. TaxID=1974203 RepID=UPI0037529CD2|nr:cobalamin-binding protein [Gracilimonas sp.]
MKIISLLPATTEIVCALDLREQLVGRSHECDYPEYVQTLPVCSQPKYPFDGQSFDIDQKVKAILSEGLSIYRINTDQIRQLNPNLILTQDQCEVCAVALKDVEQCLAQIGVEASVLSFSPETLEDILADIQVIAGQFKIPEKGLQLKNEIDQGFSVIRNKTSTLEPVHMEIIEWIDPLMAAGNWMPDLVEIAGGYCTLGESGEHSPFIDFEQLMKADPEILSIIPCGYPIQRTKSELDTLFKTERWQELKAVKNKRIYIADGHQFFNRPGPRIANSARILAEIMHPDIFKPEQKQNCWTEVY